ncbi:hypothetical protein PCANC_11373 [Puccinia coronata f. sp. avenae]|uniref:Transcription factor domain-containing protein n=1 Tax=Puccinia coronata f. sp. avenae TaxID=200324 RepID=A0A2N5SUU9_9BASI|nr:hypothetical protein PCANC_11373 [Puccinia coronata f. sp. avenae]
MKKLFLALLLLTLWTCEAFIGPAEELPDWPLNTRWGDEAELTLSLGLHDPDYAHDASHFNNLHHPSSTTPPADASNSHHDQLDSSSAWGMREPDVGFYHSGYNLDGWSSMNVESSLANLPSYSCHPPASTEAHEVLDPGTSDSFSWGSVLDSANSNTPWQHHFNDPVSDVPSNPHQNPTHSAILQAPTHSPSTSSEPSDSFSWVSILDSVNTNTPWRQYFNDPVSDVPSNPHQHPTHSAMSQAPTHSPSTLLEPHIPTSSSSKSATSFGLPIPWFTKKFLREAGESPDAHHQPSIEKLRIHLQSLEEEQQVVLDDDAKIYGFCQAFHGIIVPRDPTRPAGMDYQQATYFIDNRNIWLDYWQKRTNIRLHDYVGQIKHITFIQTFSLFLCYIEVITLILPPMEMEALDVRCKWFVKLANAISNPWDRKPEEDQELNKLAQSFAFKKPTSPAHLSAILWKFVAAWARTYRPSMVITDPKQKPEKALKVARSVTSFINAIFASSIVELTRQCKAGKGLSGVLAPLALRGLRPPSEACFASRPSEARGLC